VTGLSLASVISPLLAGMREREKQLRAKVLGEIGNMLFIRTVYRKISAAILYWRLAKVYQADHFYTMIDI
jgi:hypothetical protein